MSAWEDSQESLSSGLPSYCPKGVHTQDQPHQTAVCHPALHHGADWPLAVILTQATEFGIPEGHPPRLQEAPGQGLGQSLRSLHPLMYQKLLTASDSLCKLWSNKRIMPPCQNEATSNSLWLNYESVIKG